MTPRLRIVAALLAAVTATLAWTYGYYTMGTLMILTLRDDVKAKRGAASSIRDFHDTFLTLGPLPLPLVRAATPGDIGEPFPAGSVKAPSRQN